MAGRLCSVQSLCTIILLEVAIMLGFWVGDYLPNFFNKPPRSCDVTNSSIVRKIIQKRFEPILNRHGVTLPLECPFNLSRDLHGIRESVKRTRSSHWQCLKCGKKFFFERHLDLHIERRHNELINKAEDSVCLGAYCDIMRCDVLKSTPFLDEEPTSTDVSIWTPTPGMGKHQHHTLPSSRKSQPHVSSHTQRHHPQVESSSEESEEERLRKVGSETMEHCDESHYANLKAKCEDLVWSCMEGLISTLDAKEFKAIQNELESVSCSYLSCSRYGDKCCSVPRSKGKLRPFFIVFGSIFISLCLALAYYFVYIYPQQSSGGSAINDQDGIMFDEDLEKVTPSASSTPTDSNQITSMMIRRNPPPPLVNRTTHL